MIASPVHDLLNEVRARWRRLVVLKAVVRAALVVAVVLALVLAIAGWLNGAPRLLALLGGVTILTILAALAWGIRSVRERPSDLRVARLIEEHHPELDDRLVSAVGLWSQDVAERPALAEPMLDDAGHAAAGIPAASVIHERGMRRATTSAIAALAAVAVVLFVGRDRAAQTIDALTLMLFPSHVTLQVSPGNVRLAAGAPLTIEAHLVGSRAPIGAQLMRARRGGAEVGAEREWEAVDMPADASGRFRVQLEAVASSFSYRVAAGALKSTIYDVTVAHPPRVTRIDVDYRFPPSFGMAPQTEEDGGDIYAPEGTEVRLHVYTDRDTVTGALKMGDGTSLRLSAQDGSSPLVGSGASGGEGVGAVLTTTLAVKAENSYRVALLDGDGFSSPGDTEYFIRTLDDRPPEVHVKKPARDRNVSMLEEVEIEADAEDDFGIERFELVYAIRGATEHVVPLPVPRQTPSSSSVASVSARHTLYLEDIGVQPGDFLSYYVRARDKPRGKRSSEGRSDIFFLEVKPFEQEFVMAQSQAASGNRSLDDLVSAQKEVVVATWKLDRRTQAAGAKSDADIKSVAHTEDELKTRVEETSSSFRESNLRDPRQRPQPGRGQAPSAPAGQARPEEDAMTAAARAMGTAVTALNRLQTTQALPAEMEALNHLLRAQADVRRQQVTRQSGTGGGNRSSQDMSSLFDRELRRAQETNYETPASAAQNGDQSNLADKVKELARRQDELNQRQQQAERLGGDERRRELERLSRDQEALRRQAEEMAQSQGAQSSPGSQGSPSAGSRGSQSSQNAQGAQGAQGGNPGEQQQQRQLRAASEDMRSAASGLDQQNARQASERGAQAARRLRDLERQLRANGTDDRRRALGDAQLEARQIAEAERRLAQQIQGAQGSQGSRGAQGSGSQGTSSADDLRRLAGEQERLADRARRVQDSLDQQAAALAGGSGRDGDLQRAVSGAARDLNRQRVAERLRQNAEQLRAAASDPDARQASEQAAKAVAGQEAAARDLERLAETLATAQTPRDEASQRLTEQRGRAQELRDEINRLTREMERLGQPDAQTNGSSDTKSSSDAGRSGRGQAGSGGTAAEVARLQREYNQRLQETRQLLDQLRRDDPTFSRGGPGLTFEGQGMTLSSPGTEAFKQDFAKWEQLRQQANALLDGAESSLSQRLQVNATADRLSAGAGDRAPADYQQQVDDYFKALATQKNR